MRKVKNQEIIKGYIYEHKLAIKTVKNKESDNFGKFTIVGLENCVYTHESPIDSCVIVSHDGL